MSYEKVYNELKTKCVSHNCRELDGSEVVMAAFILMKMQEYEDIESFEDFCSSWHEHYQAYQDGYWVPIHGIGASFDYIGMGGDSDPDAKEIGVRWQLLKKLRGTYSNEELRNCVLFGRIGLGYTVSRTPMELNKLAIELLKIKEGDRIADFSTGENVFFRDCCLAYPNNKYYVFKAVEDFAEALFVRANVLGMKIRNDFCTGIFSQDIREEEYDKIFLDFDKTNGQWSDNYNRVDSAYIERRYPEYKKCLFSKEWYYCLAALEHLSDNGRMVVIMPSSSMTSVKDEKIRQYFIENGHLEAVVSLPERLYEDTKTPVAMYVFSRNNKNVTLVDARDYYVTGRSGARRLNVLSDENIQDIVSLMEMTSDESKQIDAKTILENMCVLNPKVYLKQIEIDESVQFGSVIKRITRGVQLKGKELDELISSKKTNYKYLTPANIQNGILVGEMPYIAHIDSKYERYLAQRGSLVLSKNAVPFKLLVVEEEGLLTSGNLYVIDIDDGKMNPYYIKCFLESAKGKEVLNIVSTGGTLPMLSVNAIKEIPIPYANLEQQEIIVQRYKEISEEIYQKQQEIEQALEDRMKLFD